MKKAFFSGWLSDVDRVFSENFDCRPENIDVNLIVIHSISLPPGKFGGDYIMRLFTNRLDFGADIYFEGLRGLKLRLQKVARHSRDFV